MQQQACNAHAVTNIAVCAQVCVSYIDESQDYNARQAALSDYGFTCVCSKCTAESAAAGKGKTLA